MTRIAWAEWYPGPHWKRGYGGTISLPLSKKEGEVKHSAEGDMASALAVLEGSRQASWHFTLPKDPPLRAYQHYELEDITWHCGLPGDQRADTSLIGNLTLIGEEHEGVAGEPLTAWQLENTVRLSADLRLLIPIAAPPALRLNLWEHGWLSATACPSGRIPWDGIIGALQEVDVTPEQAQQLKYCADIAAWLQSFAFPALVAQIAAARAAAEVNVDADALAAEITAKSAAALAERLKE